MDATRQGRTHGDEAGSSRSKRSRQHKTVEEVLLLQVHHEFLLWKGCNRDAKSRMGCDGEIDDMLRIRLREAGSDEDIYTLVAWIKAFNINEPIYAELCHEFYSTYENDEVYADDELQTKSGLYQAVELEEEGFNVYFEGEDVVRSLSASIYYRDLDTITLRDLIDSEDRMGRMEILQEAIERMEYRQSYH
ncbi:hypothetical protein Tco_0593443 [Tanacetum coccineum]